MTLRSVFGQLAVVVGVALAVATYGVAGRERLRALPTHARQSLSGAAPYLVLLGGVLLVNSVARRVGPQISWVIGLNVTGAIYDLEGQFVATLQSLGSPPVTAYFSWMYVYGYAFLLIFPFVAYFLLADRRPLREATIAYALNYALGLACYLLFVSYGPRNLLPELVDSLLYTYWPESKLLTTRVNTNTNVFPSLHTSLSVTVWLLAYRTRETYPAWTALSGVIAASIVVSTMYLGIHWATDVVAGVVLAVVSVRGGARYAHVPADAWTQLSQAKSRRWGAVRGRFEE